MEQSIRDENVKIREENARREQLAFLTLNSIDKNF